ncbi:MAG: hypothetical protein QOJ32_1765, partial [Frankiaceae bacterium]|nr:hypothetical protein [Frankiaceae bacterium]
GWLVRPLAHRRTGAAVVVLPADASSAGPPAYSALHQAMLDIGIAVFVPRPSGDLDLPDEVERVQELAATLLDAGIAEAGMLGAYGVAHGGRLVAASSAAAPHLFGAAVDVCGSDGLDGLLPLASEYRAREAGTGRAREAGTGSPGGARTPTLVVHGSNDAHVPLQSAERVVDALAARQIPVELLILTDDGDVERSRPARRQVAEAAVGWFRDHLVGRPGADRTGEHDPALDNLAPDQLARDDDQENGSPRP